MKKCYLAGAAKFNQEHMLWREYVRNHQIQGLEWVDPMERYDGSSDPEIPPEELVKGDLRQVRESDLMLTYRFPGVETWGTVVETWYAFRRDIPVIVISQDEDFSPWMYFMADSIVKDIDRGIQEVRRHLHDELLQ